MGEIDMKYEINLQVVVDCVEAEEAVAYAKVLRRNNDAYVISVREEDSHMVIDHDMQLRALSRDINDCIDLEGVREVYEELREEEAKEAVNKYYTDEVINEVAEKAAEAFCQKINTENGMPDCYTCCKTTHGEDVWSVDSTCDNDLVYVTLERGDYLFDETNSKMVVKVQDKIHTKVISLLKQKGVKEAYSLIG